jgi:hypothetical protein
MRPFPAFRQTPTTGIHPALYDFAEECRAVAVRMLAYLGVLALLVMGAIHLWDGLELEAPLTGVVQAQGAEPPTPQTLQLRGSL